VSALPHPDRFSLLVAGLEPGQWRLLGALALEHGLARGVLVALDAVPGAPPVVGPTPRSIALDAWLKRAVGSGLLVTVGPTRALGLTSAPSREAGYAVAPDLAQLVLRELARRGTLPDIARASRDLLGGRSVADLSLALSLGDYRNFARRFSSERLPRQIALRSAAEWLRVWLCEPFDAQWLERTWGEEADAIALRVLRESLDAPSRCDELRAWLAGRFNQLPEGEVRSELAGLLCQHLLLRAQPAEISTYLPALPRPSALGYAAAAAFIDGDLVLAQQRLSDAFGLQVSPAQSPNRRAALPQCGALMPLLALLLCARENEEATTLARRLVSVGTSDAARGAGRALRTLLRRLEQSSSEHERIDVHDLGSGAGIWEALLAAYDVQLHEKQSETRARWAQHLVRRAVAAYAAGYRFLAEQGVVLAAELARDYAAQELERQAAVELSLDGRGLSLWELVVTRPEWQKTLQALATLAGEATQAAESSLRAVWYVDMADGSLAKPALQEHRVEEGGWSQGRRLGLSELYDLRERLPEEDQRVLGATRELAGSRREFAPEASERLIGHPRVANGARGNLAVEVVRGTCRIETEQEPGYLRVVVEPAGAHLGVNVVPSGDARLVVYRVSESMQRVIELLPAQGVRVPLAQKGELLRVLGELSQSVEVQSPELGEVRKVEADTTPCLRFAPHAGAWMVQLGVRPFGVKGRFFVAGTGRAELNMVLEGERLRCERSFEHERAAIDALVSACPTLSGAVEESEGRSHHEADNWVLGEVGALTLLAELRDSGLRHELEWPEKSSLRLRGDSRSVLSGRLRVDKGWYLATGGLKLDEVTEVALSELVHAPALAGGRFVRLASGDYVELEQRMRRVIAALGAAAPRSKAGAPLRLHGAALAALDELSDGPLELDGAARDWLERAHGLASKKFELPSTLRAELRSYQVEGFVWLCRLAELGLGACLADDMGLGKTLQILALLLTRAQLGAALVVAPTSVCANWAIEARRFAPTLEVLEYVGDGRAELLERVQKDPNNKLLVCSYALLQQDQAKLSELSWASAVLDEAQFIKNSQSLRAQAAFRIRADLRIAATGTPVENHAADLWSIFNFLNPGLLGDFSDFNRRFVKPIEREESAAETPEQLLRRVIQPYVLRRLKRDVLKELPPLTELRHEVELSQDEALRYAVLRKQIHDKLFTSHGKRENKIEVLAEITRLRRFCCHPRLVFPGADREASKVQAFLELVEELRENSHRALVFSQFVDFLSIVRDELDERGISYEYLDGSTPQAKRQERVDAFQQGDASLFLISLKAGGFGLNLTAADYVIHLDPWWNPAVEAQATDRAHRIGQERRVTVYRLITKSTIEESILELHEKKRNLARSLLEDSAQAGSVSTEELLRLLAPVVT
jgi:superfamily II DNA or RNA helicase